MGGILVIPSCAISLRRPIKTVILCDDVDWAQTLKTPWNEIKEDAFGALSWKNEKMEERKRRDRMDSAMTELRVEKGMIRYIFIILDCSSSMNRRDLKPNRMVVAQQMIDKFIREFFDQNPLSQLGLIIGHHKIAQKITDLVNVYTLSLCINRVHPH